MAGLEGQGKEWEDVVKEGEGSAEEFVEEGEGREENREDERWTTSDLVGLGDYSRGEILWRRACSRCGIVEEAFLKVFLTIISYWRGILSGESFCDKVGSFAVKEFGDCNLNVLGVDRKEGREAYLYVPL